MVQQTNWVGLIPPSPAPGRGTFSRGTERHRHELRKTIAAKQGDSVCVVDVFGIAIFSFFSDNIEADDGLNVIRPTVIAESSPGRWVSLVRSKIDSGRISIPAGTTEVAVSFNLTFRSTPQVTVTLEKTGSIQSLAISSLNSAGFLVRRSSAAGDAYINWHAVGLN